FKIFCTKCAFESFCVFFCDFFAPLVRSGFSLEETMSRFQRRVLIGRGASAFVYRAYDTLDGETVAIKELIRDSELPKSELSLGRRIGHENIVRIHELIEEQDGSISLSMEYVDGGNLRDLMERSGALPLVKCLPYWKQILAALEAAHASNIIH